MKDPFYFLGGLLLQKRQLFPAGAFAGSVILAELLFTQLSHTGRGVDPGQAPPLHSCLCPLFSKRHLVCKHDLVAVCRASLPPCPNYTRTAAARPADGLHRQRAAQCSFQNGLFGVSHWFDSLFHSRISVDGCTWPLGMAPAADVFLVSCARRSPCTPAAARSLLLLCCPNTNMCLSECDWETKASR